MANFATQLAMRRSARLRGDGLPGWLKVECVVRQLAAWHNPRLDPDKEAARFTALWLAADRARRAGGSCLGMAAPDSASPTSDPIGPATAISAAGGVPSEIPAKPACRR